MAYSENEAERHNDWRNGVNRIKQCKEPEDIAIMEDRDREEGHILRKFALIK